MKQQIQDLEDLVCLAATAFSMMEGYLGPQWFEAVHHMAMEGPDKVAKAAAAIMARRGAMTTRQQRYPRPEGGAA